MGRCTELARTRGHVRAASHRQLALARRYLRKFARQKCAVACSALDRAIGNGRPPPLASKIGHSRGLAWGKKPLRRAAAVRPRARIVVRIRPNARCDRAHRLCQASALWHASCSDNLRVACLLACRQTDASWDRRYERRVAKRNLRLLLLERLVPYLCCNSHSL